MRAIGLFLTAITTLFILGCGSGSNQTETNNTTDTTSKDTSKQTGQPEQYPGAKKFNAFKCEDSIQIDGKAKEECWKNAQWYALDRLWLGEEYSNKDFQGHYKLAWDKNYLYILVEVVDDSLVDIYEDPLNKWWHDDCVEIFLDEDHSGGRHKYSHQAFAYHVSKDYDVVDLGPDEKPHLYNDHINVKRTEKEKNTYVWEFAVSIYDSTFSDTISNQKPVKLKAGKEMGFALAYCDNDTSEKRENFIGSVPVEGENKNKGFIDADIFGTLTLKER